MLGEMAEDKEGRLEVVLAVSEVETLAYQFKAGIGEGEDWDAEDLIP